MAAKSGEEEESGDLAADKGKSGEGDCGRRPTRKRKTTMVTTNSPGYSRSGASLATRLCFSGRKWKRQGRRCPR
ncbi:hypothetical protein E2562_011590 [Oryza meyeriana var. granulata]|uniref:Uncharacterized protein n=1 Tax=Oryza meyeriana var. granulata TaxID=110450 RepID=A0A6G1DW53_9ORYZ|nr:hypothetical protein E2562_011590 [Oryza meyeriana var. granulata]